MKRVNAYILSLLALVWLAACTSIEQPQESGRIPDHCIELTLGNIHPSLQTKAVGHSRGDDAYNENLVLSVDCFFYPDGGTDQNAVFTALGRGAEPVEEGDSTVYKVKIFFTDADAQRIFGSTVSGTGKVYVICNAPLSYSGGSTSVPALKEMVVENDFSAQTVQGSFVMPAEEPGTVTLTTEGDNRSASGRVHVKRSAAKMQLFIKIPETFLDESNQEWEPVLEAGVQIMLANGVKRGKVDGTYSVQTVDYISTPYRPAVQMDAAQLPEGKEQYNYSHVPFYSYPAAWTDLSDYAANFVFRIPWRIQGAGAYQWKVYQLSPNLVGQKFEPNHFYRTFVKISSLGGADIEHAVVIADCDYVVLDWMNDSASGDGQGEVPGELTTYKYLVVDQTEITLNNEESAKFTYVTSTPLSSVKITKVEYYDNNNASPLQTRNVNVTVTDKTQSVNVATGVSSVGAVTVNMQTPGLVTIDHSLEDLYFTIKVYATLTNEDNCTQDVVVIQNPSIRLIRKSGQAGDMFVNGHFSWVKNATFGTSYTGSNRDYKHSTVGFNSSGYITNSGTGGYGCILSGAFSGGSSTVSTDYFTTDIYLSTFKAGDHYTVNGVDTEYRIGDPRVPAKTIYPDFSLNNYLNGTNSYGAWSLPGDILICSQQEDDRNIIAPRFLVSSGLTELLVGQIPDDFISFVKRAATFQEAGYPAGRWRLPTEAEVAFIAARQADGTIPDIFNRDAPYYCASGRWVIIPSSGSSLIYGTETNVRASTYVGSSAWSASYYIYELLDAKFVYDLWYWGDEPAATNVYHPNGHNTTY